MEGLVKHGGKSGQGQRNLFLNDRRVCEFGAFIAGYIPLHMRQLKCKRLTMRCTGKNVGQLELH